MTLAQAELLLAYLQLLENDAFMCGEAVGKEEWQVCYHRLKADTATVTSYINSLTEHPVQLS